jgi:hypothetical protein
VKQLRVFEATFFDPPGDFDPLAHLLEAIARIPNTWHVKVLLKISIEEARKRVAPDVAILEAVGDGTLFHCYADGLEWMARYLVSLRCPLIVYQPPELRDEMRRLAAFILELAEAPEDEMADVLPAKQAR